MCICIVPHFIHTYIWMNLNDFILTISYYYLRILFFCTIIQDASSMLVFITEVWRVTFNFKILTPSSITFTSKCPQGKLVTAITIFSNYLYCWSTCRRKRLDFGDPCYAKVMTELPLESDCQWQLPATGSDEQALNLNELTVAWWWENKVM